MNGMGFAGRACVRAVASSSYSYFTKLVSQSQPATPIASLLCMKKFCSERINENNGSSSEGRLSYMKMLTLEEVEKILTDVKAQNVKTLNVHDQCEWTDYMVFATGKSDWHIRNIAQAIVYKVKQKQKGTDHLLLPGVEGHEGGKWLVIDTGNIIVHALDENARAYYDLESLWTKERASKSLNQELENSLSRVRRKWNNKKTEV